MKKIPFFKMNGSGNDFIIINNKERVVYENIDIPIQEFASRICKRAQSIGADGLILIENDEEYDFSWRFFNSDGSEVEMCGNGARCAARFAYLNNIAPLEMKFRTLAGIIEAKITGLKTCIVQLTNPIGYKDNIKLDGIGYNISFINSGVPHAVIFTDNLDNIDVKKEGAIIRNHDYFKPEGTNVDFAQIINENKIGIRTYERGVEDETLACGTGSVACAIIAILQNKAQSPVQVLTKSSKILKVYVDINNDNKHINSVYLEGDSTLTYIGTMTEEAWEY